MIIDTNIYSALQIGDKTVLDALKGESNINIPIYVVGELRFGFLNGKRNEENNLNLNKFLAQNTVDIMYPTLRTSDSYAQLALHCKRAGRALSQNDLWIAALAKETKLPLVSYDKDFEVLRDLLGDKLIILSH